MSIHPFRNPNRTPRYGAVRTQVVPRSYPVRIQFVPRSHTVRIQFESSSYPSRTQVVHPGTAHHPLPGAFNFPGYTFQGYFTQMPEISTILPVVRKAAQKRRKRPGGGLFAYGLSFGSVWGPYSPKLAFLWWLKRAMCQTSTSALMLCAPWHTRENKYRGFYFYYKGAAGGGNITNQVK